LFLVHGLLALGFQGQAYSDELKIFTSRAVATILEKIGPEFEKDTGHRLNITTGLSSEFVGRINAGEAFDVVAAPPPVLDALTNGGKVAAESKTGLVRSANGVAVRKGATKPDIGSLENFTWALLDAKSITYLPVPGVPQIIERLGLKDALAAKTTIPKTDLRSPLPSAPKAMRLPLSCARSLKRSPVG
jgi:molybdate transport system substrate-binding protein